LVAAFRATLEEAVQADLLLHVVDSASEVRDEQVGEVNKVLAEIGAERTPQVLVYNKIDLTGRKPRVERDEYGKIHAVWVSAGAGMGLDLIKTVLEETAAAAAGGRLPRPAAA
jgi:GTP-binding protein HflX